MVTNILAALGLSAWLSWMAALIPRRLRGRYFGLRNSAASLTNLLSVPLLGFAVSAWPGGTIQGYGVLLLLGVVIGLVSLGCQSWMTDVNPQITHSVRSFLEQEENADSQTEKPSIVHQFGSWGELSHAGVVGLSRRQGRKCFKPRPAPFSTMEIADPAD